MELKPQLDDRYTGAKASRIRLQNEDSVLSLARWLAHDGPNWRWSFYHEILRPLGRSGGQIHLTPWMVSDPWVQETYGRLTDSGATTPLFHIESLLSQKEAVEVEDWTTVYDELTSLPDTDWVRPGAEGLYVCETCRHWAIASWSHVDSLGGCDACNADALRVLPFQIENNVKQAISGGLLLEMVTAEAFQAAGGTPYAWESGQAGVHQAGLRFDCPAQTLECDLLADLGTTTFYVECKDKAKGNTLSTSDALEVAEARAGRLFKQIGEDTDSGVDRDLATLVVTTGKLAGNVDKDGLAAGKLSGSDLPVYVMEGGQLPDLVTELRSVATGL